MDEFITEVESLQSLSDERSTYRQMSIRTTEARTFAAQSAFGMLPTTDGSKKPPAPTPKQGSAPLPKVFATPYNVLGWPRIMSTPDDVLFTTFPQAPPTLLEKMAANGGVIAKMMTSLAEKQELQRNEVSVELPNINTL